MLANALRLMGVAGVPSWWLSEAGRGLAVAGAAVGLVIAFRLATAERRREPLRLHLAHDGTVFVDDAPVERFEVTWRGSLMSLGWRAGRRRVARIVFPDAVDAASRRELRLWALRRREHAVPAAVAP